MIRKKYTLLEIQKLGLLKTIEGEPIKSRDTIRKLLTAHEIRQTAITPYGQPCYGVTEKEINLINKRFKN